MIEGTLGSLVAAMGFTWIVTQLFKGVFKWIPQNLLALGIGELFTMAMWRTGNLQLDGADPADPWAWVLVCVYGAVAVAMAQKAHDTATNPKTLVKRVQKGKPV